MHQSVFQSSKNARLDVLQCDRFTIAAGAGVAGGGTAIAVGTDHDVSRPTAAALHEAGQQIPGTAPGFCLGRMGIGGPFGQDVLPHGPLAFLDALPQGVVDDPQMGYGLSDPRTLGVQAGVTLAGLGGL